MSVGVLYGNCWVAFGITLSIIHQRHQKQLPCEEKRFYEGRKLNLWEQKSCGDFSTRSESFSQDGNGLPLGVARGARISMLMFGEWAIQEQGELRVGALLSTIPTQGITFIIL